MIKVKSAQVHLNEQTIKELMKAMEQAKTEVEFTNEPIPDGDMSESDYVEEMKKRGRLTVRSLYSPIEYIIRLDTVVITEERSTQESLGYKLV